MVEQVAGLEFRETPSTGLPSQYFPHVFVAGLLGEEATVGQGRLVGLGPRLKSRAAGSLPKNSWVWLGGQVHWT